MIILALFPEKILFLIAKLIHLLLEQEVGNFFFCKAVQ